MKRTAALIIAAAMLAAFSACSARHGIGYVNNELSYRAAFEGMKAEVSLGGSDSNEFDDSVTDLPGLYYKSEETGAVNAQATLGLAYYYTVFKNGIFDVSAGIKYRNYFTVAYNYTYYYEAYVGSKKYHYDEALDFGYFNSNRASLIFPDAEIICPFMENLKFTVSVELVYLKWKYKGGNRVYTFSQDVSTNIAYAESDTDVTIAPGAVESMSFGTDIFSLGGIHAGIIYYF